MDVLVLGCDLNEQGNGLGRRTISRLQRAVEFSDYGNKRFFFAATFSPDFPDQPEPMSTMMLRWVEQNPKYVSCVDLLGEGSFNTRGELEKFFSASGYRRAIISAWWHLPRVFAIIWQMYGLRAARSIRYIPAWNDNLTVRIFFLELLKWVHLCVPAQFRDRAVQLYRKLFGRSSW